MNVVQFTTLEQVLNHYNTVLAAPFGHSELEPLHVNQQQIEQIIASLKTIDSPINTPTQWLLAPK